MSYMWWRRHEWEVFFSYLPAFGSRFIDCPVTLANTILHQNNHQRFVHHGGVKDDDSYQTMELMEDRKCRAFGSNRGMLEEATLFWKKSTPSSIGKIRRGRTICSIVPEDFRCRAY